jgi:hypothetical protein
MTVIMSNPLGSQRVEAQQVGNLEQLARTVRV